MGSGRYSPAFYSKLIAFLNNIVKADSEQVVLVKSAP